VAISDDQFGRLEKRVREVETTLAAHLATCTQSSENVEKKLSEVKEEISSVRESYGTLKTERDEARGAFKGMKLLLWIAGGLLTTGSIIVNVYFVLNG